MERRERGGAEQKARIRHDRTDAPYPAPRRAGPSPRRDATAPARVRARRVAPRLPPAASGDAPIAPASRLPSLAGLDRVAGADEPPPRPPQPPARPPGPRPVPRCDAAHARVAGGRALLARCRRLR